VGTEIKASALELLSTHRSEKKDLCRKDPFLIAAPSEHFSSSERHVWLFSRRTDFWFACGGASVGLLAAVLLIYSHGDRELDALDFVLSEFHLGATYDAVIRRRLWRYRQVDVLMVPLVILALTYALSMHGQAILLTSITMYAAIWHRGRQSLGVARFYQRGIGGAVSPLHDCLFRGAIYLPMLAAMLAYTYLAPTEYEGQPYLALNVGAAFTSRVGLVAALWVIAYLAWAVWRSRTERETFASDNAGGTGIHPGECWVVLAHAVAFGSSYVFGATNASFLLVLAVHHEAQYLYFTYAMARRPGDLQATRNPRVDLIRVRAPRSEAKFAAAFLLWPVIGFAGALFGGWLQLKWLGPLGVGGLFCHYWLDGRIWTRRLSPA
jgi:hypothetical protein